MPSGGGPAGLGRLRVGPDDVTHLPAVFGADAVSAGAVAARTGLKPNDIVYEFAGHSIASAADLRIEVDSHAAGEQAVVKVRRGRQRDVVLTAQF